MEKNQTYLVPDYYRDFKCKMGECRHACCEGWPISVSLKDYFMLLSAEVSKDLRIKLDCALHIAPNPSPEAYAQILPRYDGRCPMRMEDGRCALHFELGEYALSEVCRLYPRGVRIARPNECSCANSCEKVVEMLMDRDAPIEFKEEILDIKVSCTEERKHFFETAGCEKEIRMWFLSIIKDRRYVISERMVILGLAMKAMSDALLNKDHERVQKLLKGEERIYVPYVSPPSCELLKKGLEISNRMLSILDQRSESIRAYGETALSYFGSEGHAFDAYVKSREIFENACPKWEKWYEHMLVNHMFFSQFPFQDRPVDLLDEYLALCAVYMLLRFLMIGNASVSASKEHLADIASSVFRLVEHTEFDRYAGPMLKKIGEDQIENALNVLCL